MPAQRANADILAAGNDWVRALIDIKGRGRPHDNLAYQGRSSQLSPAEVQKLQAVNEKATAD